MGKKRHLLRSGSGDSSVVKIYGFVNDTAFYNREFTVPASTDVVDQGACCVTQKVNSMFGNPTIIQDPRDQRVPTAEIMTADDGYAMTDIHELLIKTDTFLKGKMDIVFDPDQILDTVREEVVGALKKTSDIMRNLFSYIEVIGNYQVFNSDESRAGVNIEAAIAAAAKYSAGAGNAEVLKDQMELASFVTTANHVYHVANDATHPEFNIIRYVRNGVVLRFTAKDSKDADLPIEMHLWWGRDAFLQNYPLTTITDAIMPCRPEFLYELLDHFKTVSQFTTETSAYVRERMDEIVVKNDHTGVANFQTNYYAYPDTQPTNTFLVTFGVVYKGHAPTIDQIKEYLRKEVLDIVPTHSEEEWRKKLPGLISERRFFMIPIYDNVWKRNPSDEGEQWHRKGIFDLTRHADILRSVIGASYVDQLQYVQLVAPKYSKFPVMAIPHLENAQTSRLISALYPDYIGLRNGETDPEEGSIDQESAPTKDFTQLFNDALADAAANNNAGTIEGIPGAWVHFTPQDGTTYYIVTKQSYMDKV